MKLYMISSGYPAVGYSVISSGYPAVGYSVISSGVSSFFTTPIGTLGLFGDRTKSDGTIAKIASFATLTPGWHFGDGGPISQGTINIAYSLVGILRQFVSWDVDAFAGSDCEICLATSYGQSDIEVIIENDGSLTIAHDSKGRQVSYKSGLSFQEAVREITAIVGKAWTTSEYFTHEITTLREGVLLASLSEIGKEAFLSSITTVYRQPAKAFHVTSGAITAPLQ